MKRVTLAALDALERQGVDVDRDPEENIATATVQGITLYAVIPPAVGGAS